MSRSNEQVHIQWRTYILSSLNYYVGPFAASKNNQQGQKGHEQGVGATPLKKIPSITQTSLLVGKGSMFGPLSRTPPQHPVHGPFDLVGYSCWLQKDYIIFCVFKDLL
jgi:hypothetical protein